MSVKFQFKLDQDLIDKLSEIDEVLSDKDFRPLMQNIGANLKDSTQERISRTKTAPDGTKWAELSDVTRDRKIKAGKNPSDILRDTSALLGGIEVQIRNDFEVAIGSNEPYARAQQEGNPRNRFFGKALAPIPARPYLGVSSADERDILKEVDKFLARLVK